MEQGRGLMDWVSLLSESALKQGMQLAAGLSALGIDAEEMVDQSRAGSDLMVSMVRSEVDKAVARMGFVREEELAALRRHVERLEAALVAAGVATHDTTAGPAAEPAVTKPAEKTTPVKKPAAKKAPVKKPAVKKPAVKKSENS